MIMDRRSFVAGLGALGWAVPMRLASAQTVVPAAMVKRAIPATGEQIPAIGMGSWITFNVGASPRLRDQRADVLQRFFDRGGGLIDSSPMYGTSEEVIGYGLARIANTHSLFSATKVWTMTRVLGVRQMQQSQALWGGRPFDLMQIHNMVDWQTHLATLQEWKAAGRIRYIGITTSHGRRHEDFADAIARQPFDFVQFTYNILNREAEARLLPLAAERGQAVIINRPFQRGGLFKRFARYPLPAWAAEFDAQNWAQFLLKFIISHPAVAVAIPATSRVDHMEENMGALYGRLPDATTRRRMIAHVESL